MRFALYLFDDEDISKDADRVIFIELKGKDIHHAIKQIDETIGDWVVAFKIRPAKMDARVVASSIPNPKFIRADLLRLENRLYEYGKGDVLIASKYLEEDV
jgi:preprotein translocase subunit Sec63